MCLCLCLRVQAELQLDSSLVSSPAVGARSPLPAVAAEEGKAGERLDLEFEGEGQGQGQGQGQAQRRGEKRKSAD